MKRPIVISLSLLALGLAACGGAKGWPQSIKETLIGSFVKEAKAQGSQLSDEKITAYCQCYQQNVQKTYPDAAELQKAATDKLMEAAKPCLEAALK